jgi:hypothetical protein
MSSLGKWWVRLGALVSTLTLAVFVPAAAWAAQTGVDGVAGELARGRGRGFGGILVGLCCLFVVGIIVVALVLVMRRRGGRR